MAPFAPKGEVAQWRVVYRLFQQAEVGATLTYDELGSALDMDPKEDRHRIQAAARKASEKFLRVDDRAVEVVPEVGYRLATAERQIPLAGAQVERATRSLEKGKDLAVHVRMEELSEEGRQIVHAMAVGFSAVAEYTRQISRRMEDHEGRLADVEAELKRIRERENS
jgi:hypothetical protein